MPNLFFRNVDLELRYVANWLTYSEQEMTTEELDKLKELAERATPGPWKFEDGNQSGPSDKIVWCPIQTTGYDEQDEPYNLICTMPNDSYGHSCTLHKNGEYIAALSPDVVLELIAEVKQLKNCHDDYLEAAGEFENDILKLRAENKLAKERYEARYEEVLVLRDQLAEAREVIESCLNTQRLRDVSKLASNPIQNAAVYEIQTVLRAYLEKYK